MYVSFLCVEPATKKKQMSTKNTESSGIIIFQLFFSDFQQMFSRQWRWEIGRWKNLSIPDSRYINSMVVSVSYILYIWPLNLYRTVWGVWSVNFIPLLHFTKTHFKQKRYYSAWLCLWCVYYIHTYWWQGSLKKLEKVCYDLLWS